MTDVVPLIALQLPISDLGAYCNSNPVINRVVCANDYFWELRYRQDYSIDVQLAAHETYQQRYREVYLAINKISNVYTRAEKELIYGVSHDMEQLVLRAIPYIINPHMSLLRRLITVVGSQHLNVVTAVATFIIRHWAMDQFIHQVYNFQRIFYYPTAQYLWDNYIEATATNIPEYNYYRRWLAAARLAYTNQVIPDDSTIFDRGLIVANDGLNAFQAFNHKVHANDVLLAHRYHATKMLGYIQQVYTLDVERTVEYIMERGDFPASLLLLYATSETIPAAVTVMQLHGVDNIKHVIDIVLALYRTWGHRTPLETVFTFLHKLMTYNVPPNMELYKLTVKAYQLVLPPLNARSTMGDRFVTAWYQRYRMEDIVNITGYYFEYYAHYFTTKTTPTVPFEMYIYSPATSVDWLDIKVKPGGSDPVVTTKQYYVAIKYRNLNRVGIDFKTYVVPPKTKTPLIYPYHERPPVNNDGGHVIIAANLAKK